MSFWKMLVTNPQAKRLSGDALEKMLRERLGPTILNNAKRTVPIGVSRKATRNAPAHRAGALQRALGFDVTREGAADATLIVGVDAGTGENVTYGSYVEDGTSRMAAQPYLRPAVYQAKGVIK